MTPLDLIHFDATGYVSEGDSQAEDQRVWQTPEGDGLGVYFIPLPPDLPVNTTSVDELAAFYQQQMAQIESGKLIEAGVVSAGNCPTVCTIVSVPQKPSGRIYVGSLTVPFRDFSYVLKCQCGEDGPTGLKEAVLFDRSQAAGESVTIHNDGTFTIPGWNPDDPKFDVEFPSHPVARVRRVLAHITDSFKRCGGGAQDARIRSPTEATMMSALLADLLSGDATRIWSATSAITTLRDAQELDLLAAHLAEIEAKTAGVSLSGALMPNSERLKFALRKLAYWRDKEGCLCRLYPEWLMFDPKKEEAAGNVCILRTKTDRVWTVGYDCRCTICETDYAVEEGEYHYTWWKWTVSN